MRTYICIMACIISVMAHAMDQNISDKEKKVFQEHYIPTITQILTKKNITENEKIILNKKIDGILTQSKQYPFIAQIHSFITHNVNHEIIQLIQKNSAPGQQEKNTLLYFDTVISLIKPEHKKDPETKQERKALAKKKLSSIFMYLLNKIQLSPRDNAALALELYRTPSIFTNLAQSFDKQTLVSLKKNLEKKYMHKTWRSKFLGIVLNPPKENTKPQKPQKVTPPKKTKKQPTTQNPKIFVPIYLKIHFLEKKLTPKEELIDLLSKTIAQDNPKSVNKKIIDQINHYLGKQKSYLHGWKWIPWISKPTFTIKKYITNEKDQELFVNSIQEFIFAQRTYKKNQNDTEYLYLIDKIMHDLTQLVQRNTINIDTYMQENKKSLFADILEEKKKLEKLVTKDKRIPFIPLEKYLMTVTTDMLALAQTIEPK